MRQHGNGVWGRDGKIPFNKFHVITTLWLHYIKERGKWVCPGGYRNEMRCQKEVIFKSFFLMEELYLIDRIPEWEWT